ncbi:MAG: hypothetical protein LH480_06725 [Rubrivivax sp.]|nr:hypothetical protein [Rubrivivax sp.]
MKYLILLGVILIVAWWTFGRRRPGGSDDNADGADRGDAAGGPPSADKSAAAPQDMLACAHCNVHLPRSEALFDADERAFCSDAHRLAGPHSGSQP